MTNVIGIRGGKEAPQDRRSSMETMIITQAIVEGWELPPFQRPLRINDKIKNLAEEIKADGVSVPGVLTLGRLGRSGQLYLVDGQHRVQAFKMSQLPEAIADVRIVHFDTMGEMGQAYVDLNSALVKMKPDDILRGLGPTSKALQLISSECRFVTYNQVRRGLPKSPTIGMAQVLRSWWSSQADTPAGHTSGRTAVMLVNELDEDPESVAKLVRFLNLAGAAWGSDKEYYRAWGTLNITMCMWLYRRLVLDRTRGVKRYVTLNETQFKQCLMALSADGKYMDFLVGRILGDRDRNPTYTHIKRVFSERLKADGMPTPLFPQTSWSK